MFKKTFTVVVCVFAIYSLNAQVLLQQDPLPQIHNSNVFLDASSNFGQHGTANNNDFGVGLVFPTVDLATFSFRMYAVSPNPPILMSFFDGMIVYNRTANAVTSTISNPIPAGWWEDPEFRSATATPIEPGFYFFYNPNGRANHTAALAAGEPPAVAFYHAIRGGEWRRIGDGGANDHGGNFWRVGGNDLTDANTPHILGNRPPETPAGNNPVVDVPGAPIIVYGSVRNANGDLISRPIMHIGQGAM